MTNPAQKIVLHVSPGTTKVIATFVITIDPMATPASFFVRQSLFYFDKVVDSLLSCNTKCPEVAGATTGVGIGTSPPTCLFCQTSLSQVYKNGQCKCKTGFYYDASLVCQPCTDPNCATCSPPTGGASTTICTECLPIATLNERTKICECNKGVYLNTRTYACEPCRYGCAKCTSPDDCF